jgi:hypothetical protein
MPTETATLPVIKSKAAKQPIAKINYNLNQKNKQIKILQYYKRSFKSQLAPAREIQKHKRTRKQAASSNPSNSGKLTKVQLDKERTQEQEKQQITKDSDDKKDNYAKKEKKLEKHETITKPHQKGGDTENQIVNMDD